MRCRNIPVASGSRLFSVAAPDDVSPAVRLRQWLKSALRSARFRALSVRETDRPPPREERAAEQVEGGAWVTSSGPTGGACSAGCSLTVAGEFRRAIRWAVYPASAFRDARLV